jgi:hypothetical protein
MSSPKIPQLHQNKGDTDCRLIRVHLLDLNQVKKTRMALENSGAISFISNILAITLVNAIVYSQPMPATPTKQRIYRQNTKNIFQLSGHKAGQERENNLRIT